MPVRRLLKFALLSVLALQLFYLVAANAVLAFAPRLVNLDPETFRVRFHALTFIPGIVHVTNLQVRGQDRFVQWQLDVPHAKAKVDLRALTSARLRVLEASGGEVRFRLRSKLDPKASARAAAHFPSVDGFADPPVRDDARFPLRPRMPTPWWLEFEQLDFDVSEVWVNQARFEGEATAAGNWKMKPDHAVEVGPALLSLESGTLHVGEEQVAASVTGTIGAVLHRFDPLAVPNAEVLRYLDAKTSLTLSGARPALLGHFTDAVRFDGTPGVLEVKAVVERGVVQDGTTVQLEAERVRARVGKVAIRGKLRAKVYANDAGKGLRWETSARGVSIRVPGTVEGELARAGALVLKARSTGRDLRTLTLPKKGSLELSGATVSELKSLNAFIPSPLKLELLDGKAEARLQLALDFVRGRANGELALTADSLEVRQGGETLSGGLSLTLKLKDLTATKVRLDGTVLEAKKMSLAGEHQQPWSGSVRVKRGSLDLKRRKLFQGEVAAKLDDSRPLARHLLHGTKVPRFAESILAPDHVEASAELELGRGLVSLRDGSAKVGRVQISAAGLFKEDERRGVAHLSLGPAKLGIELMGQRRSMKTFPGRDWFERLSGYIPAA